MKPREKENERIEIKPRKWFLYNNRLTDQGGTRWLIFHNYSYWDGQGNRQISELLEGTRLGASFEEAETQAILVRKQRGLTCPIKKAG